MDVHELREAFLLTETIEKKIKDFKEERVKTITSQTDQSQNLAEGPKIILHLIPLSAFASNQNVDLKEAKEFGDLLKTLDNEDSPNPKYNLDGLQSIKVENERTVAYTQFFRNGIIELVFVDPPDPPDPPDPSDEKYSDYFPSYLFEGFLINRTKEFISFFQKMLINTPIIIFLNFDNFHNKRMLYSNNGKGNKIVLHKRISLRTVVIESFDKKVETIYRPLFDMLWNAFGLARCENYDSNGERINPPGKY